MSESLKQEGIQGGKGAASLETPSGIRLEFASEPKRQYKVNDEEVPSVTQILDCLNKPALPWWGMGVGADGVLSLIKMGEFALTPNPSATGFVGAIKDGDIWKFATKESLIDKLNEKKLTVNHVKEQAGDRGQNVHDALERWAVTGEMPDPKDFSFEEEGYVKALVGFIQDTDPEPVAIERMVGSAEHKFAGRFDLECMINVEKEAVYKALTTKGEPLKAGHRTARIPTGLYVLDLKTSKDVYYTHFLQGEGYEIGRRECGYDPSRFRGVIHCSKHGLYQLRVNYDKVGPEDFLAVRAVYDAQARAEKAVKS